jgi:hypothetical protein
MRRRAHKAPTATAPLRLVRGGGGNQQRAAAATASAQRARAAEACSPHAKRPCLFGRRLGGRPVQLRTRTCGAAAGRCKGQAPPLGLHFTVIAFGVECHMSVRRCAAHEQEVEAASSPWLESGRRLVMALTWEGPTARIRSEVGQGFDMGGPDADLRFVGRRQRGRWLCGSGQQLGQQSAARATGGPLAGPGPCQRRSVGRLRMLPPS